MNLYFAYGSNLHPVRLENRLGPAPLKGIGTLGNMEIHFQKTGGDGSGKATIQECADPQKKVWGAIYKLNEKQEKLLDKFESLGAGYNKIYVDVQLESGEEVFCMTYQGMEEYVNPASHPFHWYKQLVIQGSEYLGFPEDYIEDIKQVPSVTDTNQKRVSANKRLIKIMTKKK